MENHETTEATQRRASQEDPIVMYLVVRESINMSIGKTAAQVGHSTQMLTLEYFEMKDKSKVLQKKMGSAFAGDRTPQVEAEYATLARPISIFGEWMASSFRKVVLKADEKEWARLKEEVKNDPHVMVVDAGLTELEPGTATVIGLWPVRKSQVSKTVKRLQVLK
jgi:peptidyl-tRNA hydrolase